ncbi:MAG TPA: substrate-binding domain-containing protein, partial [Phycisphaerae bacterium]|nr:substrate-binding domain-containing protein [Phycisphaerae bacterium]
RLNGKPMRTRAIAAAMLALSVSLAACGLGCGGAPEDSSAPSGSGRGRPIRLATTTSTDNTGLLDRLLPPFERWWGARVHVIAVGTGRALQLGRNGDADVLLVHAPEAEEAFMAEGAGVNRRSVMFNDFLVVGPSADPAAVARADGPADALARIARAETPFVSRGDDSGTHKMELSLWKKASLEPAGGWYLEAGQGMGATLLVAEEKRAYCLTDRGTFLAMRANLALVPLYENPEALANHYSIIAVNPAVHPDTNYFGAMALVAWVTSPEGQQIIGDFRVDGEALFHPLAVPPAPQSALAPAPATAP